MTKSVGAALSTFEWIALPDSQIRSHGLHPADRVCYTGHSTFIRPQYLQSVGKWGALETSDMVSTVAPHKAMLHVSPSAFRQFKTRFRLMTRSQFERHHGPHLWTRAEVSFKAHARAQRAFGLANGTKRGYAAPIGTACAYAVATARVTLGLLPIEVVLWSSILGQLLCHHGMSIEDWDAFTDDDKLGAWKLGRDGMPWDVDRAACEAAPLHVDGGTLEAADWPGSSSAFV